MSSYEGRQAVPNGLPGVAAAKCKRHAGLTLLEVAIAGAILMGGLAILAQLVRTTLSNTTPGFSQGSQVGPMVEQQMKLHAAYFKGQMKPIGALSGVLSIGTQSIYSAATPRGLILPTTTGYGGRSYGLRDEEVTVKLTISPITPDASDPLVGYIRYWKLEVASGGERAGL